MSNESSDLWAVTIQGPDDIFAAASREEAITLAHRFNTWWIDTFASKGLHPFEPTLWAAPTVWNISPETHAASLLTNSEYGWLRSKAESSHDH